MVRTSTFNRLIATGAVFVAALFSGATNGAELPQNWTLCVNKNAIFSPDLAISGCTALIQSGRESERNLAMAFNNRGTAYSEKEDFDRAIADYNEAIRLNVNYANAFNNRGVAHKAKGSLDRALADYGEAIRLDPKHARAFNNRGLAYFDIKNYERAIADYDEAVRLDPGYANALHNRGDAYWAKGDVDRAFADYGRARGLDRDLPPKVKAVAGVGI
jgi:tetratricopeptide (TPR) repeat protein